MLIKRGRGGRGRKQRGKRGGGVKPGQCGGQDFFPDFGLSFLFDILPYLSVCYLRLSPNLSAPSSPKFTVRCLYFIRKKNLTRGTEYSLETFENRRVVFPRNLRFSLKTQRLSFCLSVCLFLSPSFLLSLSENIFIFTFN